DLFDEVLPWLQVLANCRQRGEAFQVELALVRFGGVTFQTVFLDERLNLLRILSGEVLAASLVAALDEFDGLAKDRQTNRGEDQQPCGASIHDIPLCPCLVTSFVLLPVADDHVPPANLRSWAASRQR